MKINIDSEYKYRAIFNFYAYKGYYAEWIHEVSESIN